MWYNIYVLGGFSCMFMFQWVADIFEICTFEKEERTEKYFGERENTYNVNFEALQYEVNDFVYVL